MHVQLLMSMDSGESQMWIDIQIMNHKTGILIQSSIDYISYRLNIAFDDTN